VILLVSLAVGLTSALFPPVNIEAYLVGVAALHAGPLLWGAVLTATVGHMCGKMLFYALGRGWLLNGLTGWVNRRHELDEALVAAETSAPSGPGSDAVVEPGRATAAERGWRGRLRSWGAVSRVEALAERRWATAALCVASAAGGVPPFAIVAVLLGRFRMRVTDFVLFGGLGRLARFSAVAGLSGVVLGRV
jgi:membrane protein YqaA with SNARE-associated domain